MNLVSKQLLIDNLDLAFIASQIESSIASSLSEEQIIRYYFNYGAGLYINGSSKFDEFYYRLDRKDVDEAVLEGRFASGYDHWLSVGKYELRKSDPTNLSSRYQLINDELDYNFLVSQYPEHFSRLYSRARNLRNYLILSQSLQLNPTKDFNESVYRAKYTDVQNAIQDRIFLSGFHHWVSIGRQEGRNCLPSELEQYATDLWPELDFELIRQTHLMEDKAASDDLAVFAFYCKNAAALTVNPNAIFDESFYQTAFPDVTEEISRSFYVSGFHHWVKFGRKEGRPSKIPLINTVKQSVLHNSIISSVPRSRWTSLFDEQFYTELLARDFGIVCRPETAFSIFIQEGVFRGDIPLPDFDEQFYTLYYADVYSAKREGTIPSGFVHYVLIGQQEGRLISHDLAKCLEKKVGVLVESTSNDNIRDLEKKLSPIKFSVTTNERKLNVFVPSLDPDIMFGGYISLLNYLARVAESGLQLRLIICEDGQSNHAWFLKGIHNRDRWLKAFEKCEFVNLSSVVYPLQFGWSDLCLAYSAWTAYSASAVAKMLRCKRIIFFIQEYEAIFYENNSLNFLVEAAYELSHVALFNTSILERSFRDNGIGVFSSTGSGRALSYQHALADNKPSFNTVRHARRQTLLFYARPEKHAGRNLYEIGVLALRRAIAVGVLDQSWDIIGVGSLGDYREVELGYGAILKLMTRLPFHEYEALLGRVDVGLSLMWAPHPSILPFELAKAGAVCVVNEFRGRSSAFYNQFGNNIVAAAPSIDGIVEAISTAVSRVDDFEARIRGATFDWPTDWDEVFSPSFISASLALPFD